VQATDVKIGNGGATVMLYQKIHCGYPVVCEIGCRFGCLGVSQKGEGDFLDGGIGGSGGGQRGGDSFGYWTAGVFPPFDFKPGVCLSGFGGVTFARQVVFLAVDPHVGFFLALVDTVLWGSCFCHDCTSLVKNVPLGTFSVGTMSKNQNQQTPQTLVL